MRETDVLEAEDELLPYTSLHFSLNAPWLVWRSSLPVLTIVYYTTLEIGGW